MSNISICLDYVCGLLLKILYSQTFDKMDEYVLYVIETNTEFFFCKNIHKITFNPSGETILKLGQQCINFFLETDQDLFSQVLRLQIWKLLIFKSNVSFYKNISCSKVQIYS